MRKDPKLFQHGTLAMLVADLFDGTMSIEEVIETWRQRDRHL